MKRPAVSFSILLFSLLNCSNNPSGPSISTSETWRLFDVGTQNQIDIALSKLSTGGVVTSGTFHYLFYGDTITGTISIGSAVIIDSSVTIAASGSASYPATVSGPGASSPFSLNMSGVFKDSVATGTWNIVFSDSPWQGWISPGHFSGRLQSGGGITAQK
jgi:hypothetical protein